MAAITLLASGVQAASGSSTPLDVSAYAQIRGTIALTTDMGQECDVFVNVQVAPTSSGPWRDIVKKRFNSALRPSVPDYAPPVGNYPFTIPDVDSFARVTWSAVATKNTKDGSPSLTLGVTGTTVPV
jgi:hypothetical protein